MRAPVITMRLGHDLSDAVAKRMAGLGCCRSAYIKALIRQDLDQRGAIQTLAINDLSPSQQDQLDAALLEQVSSTPSKKPE